MYRTCIFCHGDLLENEAIEEFPVGRRLAFDSKRGRLWVVCRRCERWNLSPLETRWEAIEACERAFRDTRMRAASDNIGLAKLREGLVLVRVGDPLREEFAAWRYGDQFGRRRRRTMLVTGAAVAAGGALIAGGVAAGFSMGAFGGFHGLIQRWRLNRVVLRARDAEGRAISVQRKHLYTSRLLPADNAAGWDLQVDHVPGWSRRRPSGVPREERASRKYRRSMIVRGDEAIALGGKLMARANHWGGRPRAVRDAVARIERAGHPEAFLPEAARAAERASRTKWRKRRTPKQIERLTKPVPGSLAGLDVDMRLAIEMATHEQSEREALEGELKELEARWREAEEIARIADRLLVPDSVEARIREAGGDAQESPGPT